MNTGEMYKAEIPYFVAFVVLILSTPFLPSSLILLLDNIIIRITIIFILLFLISKGPISGIFGLITIALLYSERNRRKILVAQDKFNKMDVNYLKQMSVSEESQSQESVQVPNFNIPPRDDEISYLPTDEIGSDVFYPVGTSINTKNALDVIPSGSVSQELFEELGVGHINIHN